MLANHEFYEGANHDSLHYAICDNLEFVGDPALVARYERHSSA